MTKLRPSTILGLHEAGVRTGLTGRRPALLAGIDPRIVMSLETLPDPASQLLADLNTLNQIERLPDGSVPLESLLQHATLLVRPRADAAVFERALVELTGAPVPVPSPAGSLSPAGLSRLVKRGVVGGAVVVVGAVVFVWIAMRSSNAKIGDNQLPTSAPAPLESATGGAEAGSEPKPVPTPSAPPAPSTGLVTVKTLPTKRVKPLSSTQPDAAAPCYIHGVFQSDNPNCWEKP